MLHEYFARSWGMFVAAERSRNSGVAAMLTGLSFELAFKALLVITTGGHGRGHRVSDILDKVPDLSRLMEGLWGDDFRFMLQLVDEDINSSQMRYGSSGSDIDRATLLIASSIAHEPSTWSSSLVDFYEELMCSIGSAIWGNYPKELRDGRKPVREFELRPIYSVPDHSPPNPKPVDSGMHPSTYGLLLLAEKDGKETDFGAIIPFEHTQEDGTYHVRVRVGKNSAVDQRIDQTGDTRTLSSVTWVGEPVSGVRLRLHEARSVLQDVRPGAGTPRA